jgi:gluconate 2-dehydrogenase alpha chain
MLGKRKSFELRLQTRVLDILYDRKAERARGVRYIDRVTGEEHEQPADVVVLSSFTMSNTRFLLMAGIGTPYNPKTGSRGRRQEFLPPDNVRHACLLQGSLDQPVLASGASQTVIDEFNGDNFDHSGLGFFGGG